MTVPPQPPYRVLERSRNDRVIGGVCGGVATFLNMDPTLVRVLTVVLSLFTGVPIVLYLIALFVVPEEGGPQRRQGYPPVAGPPTYDPYPYQSGQQPPMPDYAPGPGAPSRPRQYGVPPTPEDEGIWGPGGAPWQQPATPPPGQPPSEAGGEGPTGGRRP